MRARDWMEEMLVNAVGAVEYPATPDIVAGVRARLASAESSSRRRTPPVQRWAPAFVAGAVLIVVGFLVALAVSQETRDAVADFLGLGVEGEEIAILPTPGPGETPTPLPSPRPIETYATPIPAGALRARVGFEPATPAGSGEPAASYVADFAGVEIVILSYERFDLWQVRLEGETFGKGIGVFEKGAFTKEARVIEQLQVNGELAYWIGNGSHIVRFVDARGTVVTGSERTVERNTLVWRSATGMNYRLETDLSRDEALALAESLP
jgi:hypothetical protein